MSQQQSDKVLIIDDDATLLAAMTDILELNGLNVVTAVTGQEGIDQYQRQNDRFSLVIVDLKMPDMNGVETCQRLVDLDPDVKLLISSGYKDNQLSHKLSQHNLKGIIQKPFHVTHLMQTLQRIIA